MDTGEKLVNAKSEWLDLRFKMEEARYRRNCEELDRSRVRTFSKHREEQRTIKKELLELQKDRNRYEREKMLRARESKKEELAPVVVVCKNIPIVNGDSKTFPQSSSDSKIAQAAGGIASIAFEPDSPTRVRDRLYSRAKTEALLTSAPTKIPRRRDYEAVDANRDIKSDIFPRTTSNMDSTYAHSRGSRALWGNLWMSAKKEHEILIEKSSSPWVDLMLKTEKQKVDKVNKRWDKFLVSFRKHVFTGHCSSDEESDTGKETQCNGQSFRDNSKPERTKIKWNDTVQCQNIPAREWNNRVHYQDCPPRSQETQSEGMIDSKYRPRLKNNQTKFI